ncbi:uncharacterized protein LOC143908791 [Temnothorax americanus]|uniref:uncharacterized protein LOC143908791 n=1 Tax=Temnothorax americanus TaxID=1964332 RepID=UPI00406947C7
MARLRGEVGNQEKLDALAEVKCKGGKYTEGEKKRCKGDAKEKNRGGAEGGLDRKRDDGRDGAKVGGDRVGEGDQERSQEDRPGNQGRNKTGRKRHQEEIKGDWSEVGEAGGGALAVRGKRGAG